MRPLLLALLAALFAGSAVAEIAPFYYERMQKDAAEALAVEVLNVDQTVKTTSEGTFTALTVKARVRQVERSASGVKPGDVFTIIYSVAEHTAARAGDGKSAHFAKG